MDAREARHLQIKALIEDVASITETNGTDAYVLFDKVDSYIKSYCRDGLSQSNINYDYLRLWVKQIWANDFGSNEELLTVLSYLIVAEYTNRGYKVKLDELFGQNEMACLTISWN